MAEKHFYEQRKFTKEYLLPYFQINIPHFTDKKVLEVGCAEGGLLEILMELGITAVGIEISPERALTAKKINPELNILVADITDKKLLESINDKFDVIIIREVLEHLQDKETAFKNLSALLNENGYLFISFPPKRSPFAGHQQIGKSILKMIPYLHILPLSLLNLLARVFKERDGFVDEIKFHYSTGCTIKTFERLTSKYNMIPVRKELFLFRPVYSIRFGLPTIRIPSIPFLREFIAFGCESLLKISK